MFAALLTIVVAATPAIDVETEGDKQTCALEPEVRAALTRIYGKATSTRDVLVQMRVNTSSVALAIIPEKGLALRRDLPLSKEACEATIDAVALLVEGHLRDLGWPAPKSRAPSEAAQTETGVDANAVSSTTATAKSDVNSDADSEAKSAVNSGAKSDVNSDSKPDVNSDAKSDVNSDAKSDVNSGNGTDVNSGNGTESADEVLAIRVAKTSSSADWGWWIGAGGFAEAPGGPGLRGGPTVEFGFARRGGLRLHILGEFAIPNGVGVERQQRPRGEIRAFSIAAALGAGYCLPLGPGGLCGDLRAGVWNVWSQVRGELIFQTQAANDLTPFQQAGVAWRQPWGRFGVELSIDLRFRNRALNFSVEGEEESHRFPRFVGFARITLFTGTAPATIF